MPVLNCLIGEKFGRLTVTERADNVVEPSGHSRVMWRCVCDCGKVVVIQASSLKSGATKSCGCAKAERNRAYFTTHNGAKERLYGVWIDMKKRCYNPNYKQYKDYGGRGIAVCDEWLHDYSAFRKFSLENGYDGTAKPGDCTIDRIDVNGNYCPDNCRFVDRKVQNNNKRRCKIGSI